MDWHHHSLQGQAIFRFQVQHRSDTANQQRTWLLVQVITSKKIPFVWGLAKNFFTGYALKWASSKNWSKISKRKQNSKRVVSVLIKLSSLSVLMMRETTLICTVPLEAVPGFCPPTLPLSNGSHTEAKHPWWQKCWPAVSECLGCAAGCLRGTCQEQGPAFLT